MRYVKAAYEPNKKVPNGQGWNNLNNKINEIVLDYNPKYKINIYESVLTKRIK